MRSLYLLRHGKSSWKNDEQTDFDRPLAGRGRKACAMIGELIEREQIEFDLTLCSPAVRTRETIELIRQRAKLRSEVRFDERIYEATAAQLWQVISQVDDERKSVLLVGHNPGLEDLLTLITGERQTFPTCCLAKVKLKVSKWSEPNMEKATLEWLVRPRELEKA